MYDFTKFQLEFFPEWIDQFRSGTKTGEYSYKQGGPTSLYGTTDMLINLYGMGELNLNESEKDEWAETINQFQDPTSGWYKKTYTLPKNIQEGSDA